jgi:TonB family protein
LKVSSAKPVFQPEPQFSRIQLEQAPAELDVDLDVDEQGRVSNATVVPGQRADAVIIATTLSAARRWRYVPAELNGRKVPTKVTVHFVFSKPR